MNKLIGAMLVTAMVPGGAWGQTATPVQAAPAGPAVDPARLAAARGLIDVLMPPATREQMMQGMVGPMLTNLRRGLSDNPQFQAMGHDPRVKAMFDDFMVKQEARTMELMRQALPGMTSAMASAYARRFDLRQLHELRAFFETPTGRAYTQASFTIMSDPDIAAWQRQMMAQSMTHVQQDVAAFSQQVSALEPTKP